MSQPLLSDMIVNVASVPHRSPFRYPGGKTWLIPRIRDWLRNLDKPAKELIEPFAGGGIVGLTAAFEKLVCHVTLVELDDQVASVWQTIFSDDVDWLITKIGDFDCTLDAVIEEIGKRPRSTRHKAFQTILKNRTYHGGILAPGSAPTKHGENGKGISSRWYPTTLQRRLRDIASVREQISFIQGDGLDVMTHYEDRNDIAYFVDPPYTAAGKKAGRRLYNCFELDHERLFSICEQAQGDFLMTYDDSEGVKKLADIHHFETAVVAMQNTHLAKMKELLIGRNREPPRPHGRGF